MQLSCKGNGGGGRSHHRHHHRLRRILPPTTPPTPPPTACLKRPRSTILNVERPRPQDHIPLGDWLPRKLPPLPPRFPVPPAMKADCPVAVAFPFECAAWRRVDSWSRRPAMKSKVSSSLRDCNAMLSGSYELGRLRLSIEIRSIPRIWDPPSPLDRFSIWFAISRKTLKWEAISSPSFRRRDQRSWVSIILPFVPIPWWTSLRESQASFAVVHR